MDLADRFERVGVNGSASARNVSQPPCTVGNMPDAEAAAIAATQGGVVSIIQVDELGFTPRMRDYRLSTDRWQAVGRLGYRLLPMTEPLDLLRAAVALLPGAVVSHESAALMRGFRRSFLAQPTVTVHTRTTHLFPGVRVRRSHDLLGSHWSTVDGLPVTSVERTVVDLAACMSPVALSDLVQDIVIARQLDVAVLEGVVGEVCRRGRPGSATMREVLAGLATEPVGQSVLERRGRELLAFGMLPEPAHEFPIPWAPGRRFDDAYPGARLAIEWDSRSWHGKLDRIENDRRRDRECLVHGWRMLRFTWDDVTVRQNDVIAAVSAVLDSRSS